VTYLLLPACRTWRVPVTKLITSPLKLDHATSRSDFIAQAGEAGLEHGTVTVAEHRTGA
jgi:hypothetical protein